MAGLDAIQREQLEACENSLRRGDAWVTLIGVVLNLTPRQRKVRMKVGRCVVSGDIVFSEPCGRGFEVTSSWPVWTLREALLAEGL